MKWYVVDEEYLTYLRNYEKRIPEINYGEDKLKPFFGALFEIGDLVYITQVSHPKKRHNKIKENIDFLKLYNANQLIAVVNLNYMFPVHKSRLVEVQYKYIENFRKFQNEILKNGYITLLKKEMKEIRRRKIDEKAVNLYNHKYDYPLNAVSLRCLDFKKLEQKCIEYEHTKQLVVEAQEQAAPDIEEN